MTTVVVIMGLISIIIGLTRNEQNIGKVYSYSKKVELVDRKALVRIRRYKFFLIGGYAILYGVLTQMGILPIGVQRNQPLYGIIYLVVILGTTEGIEAIARRKCCRVID